MSESKMLTCTVCQVRIQCLPQGDRVYFSYGPPGTRLKLWQRVCQHVDKAGCINRRDGHERM